MAGLKAGITNWTESHGLIVLLLLELGMIAFFGRRGRGPNGEG